MLLLRVLPALAMLAMCANPLDAVSSQPATQPAGKSRVFVVPITGPLRYQIAVSEINKVIRAATAQKPDAVVFVISSPGGGRQIALAITEQIASLPVDNVVAYVTGEHGGAYGPAVLPLLACDHIFIAPDNTIDPHTQATSGDGQTGSAEEALTAQQVNLLRAWSARHQRAWGPIKDWLDRAGVLSEAAAGASSQPGSSDTAGKPSDTQAVASRSGLQILQARSVEDLDEVLAELGLTHATVITWPDPVAKSNDQMQRVFETADRLIRQTNETIGAAREADPRAAKYELQDFARQYTVNTYAPTTRHAPPQIIYQQTDTVTDHDLFADGGAAWRARTDRCIALVRKAIESNRNLVKMAGLYPEINADVNELNESYETLSTWLNQLRAERGVRSPP